MNCVDKGETKSNNTATFDVLYSPQRDGGFAFQHNLLEVERKHLLQKFSEKGNHWISCCAIKDNSFNATYDGKRCIALSLSSPLSLLSLSFFCYLFLSLYPYLSTNLLFYSLTYSLSTIYLYLSLSHTHTHAHTYTHM